MSYFLPNATAGIPGPGVAQPVKPNQSNAEMLNDATAANESFRVTEFTSFTQTSGFSDQWDELVERVGGDLFGSYDWCETWWKHFGHGRSLRIQVAHAGERMVAVLPFFEETLRWGPISIRSLRLVGSDHVGTRCCLSIDSHWLDLVVQDVHRKFCDEKFDVIHMGDLPGYSPDLQDMVTALHDTFGERSVVYVSGHYPHAVFDLPASFEEYIVSLSANERSNIRKSHRRLEEHPEVVLEDVDPERMDSHFDD